MFGREKDHGTALVAEFDELVTNHRDRALTRVPIVRERLAALEAEEADLRTLLARLEAAAPPEA